MIIFPEIAPEIFSISIFGFDFSIRWYALAYIVGFVIAFYLMKFFLSDEKFWASAGPPISVQSIDNLMTFLIVGVILGGRLGYVFFYNLQFYLANPFDIIRVWDGGMSFHGGFLGVIVAFLIFSSRHNVNVWSGADLIAVSTPPGLFLGRVANFINAELWGSPTEKPWGVVFPGQKAQQCPSLTEICARHPSQLYEAALEGLLLFLVLFFVAKAGGFKKPRLLSGLFFFGYGFSRFLVEYFRVPDQQFVTLENPNGWILKIADIGVTMGQALSIPMIFLGLLMIFLRKPT